MSALKRITAMAFVLLALQAAAPARAASLQVWNGWSWSDSGTVDFYGPVEFSYVGSGQRCDMRMSLSIVNGSATVTSASFTGNGNCDSLTAHALPWRFSAIWQYSGSVPPVVGAPVMTPPLYSVDIAGLRIAFSGPFGVTCPSPSGTATMTAYLDHAYPANGLVFSATLGPCRLQTRSSMALRSSTPVKAI